MLSYRVTKQHEISVYQRNEVTLKICFRTGKVIDELDRLTFTLKTKSYLKYKWVNVQ